jgi:hypothetical protein
MSDNEDLFAQRRAEVLRLTYAENLGIRAIARKLKIARKTVRRLLDGDRATKKAAAVPRARMLDRYDGAIRPPCAPPLHLGAPALDGISLREPDLALYDQLVAPAMTRDPGEPPADPSAQGEPQ